MHDCIIDLYEVNLKKHLLTIHSHDSNKHMLFTAYDVLTHSFENILQGNIILSINEFPIHSFWEDNVQKLSSTANYCWPICYSTLDELKDYLINNCYKYIKINSSYGMFGWILAKDFKIEEKVTS